MYSQHGQVSVVSQKPFTDKWGKNITLYSFQLAGDNRWYRTGKVQPACNQGDMIEFIFEMKGNNCNVDANSITGGSPVQAAAPQQAPPPAPAQGATAAPQAAPAPAPAAAPAAKAATRDSYWADKEAYDKAVTQPRIAYAAAQKSAVAIVAAALQHDVLGFGNAKKADKLDMLVSYVKEVTNGLALDLDNAHNILADLKNGGGSSAAPAETLADEDGMYDGQ